MSDPQPDCRACGLCCMGPGGPPDPYPEDSERWAAEGRPEIGLRLSGGRGARCPFLLSDCGYRCSIYETRPLVCRHFAAGGSACLALRRQAGAG